MKNDLINQGAILSGLVAAPFYMMLLFALGILEPGYSHLSMPMSLLGGVAGVRGLIFNVGVAVTGLFIIFFAQGFYRKLPSKLSGKFGLAFLIVGGIGLIGAGYFHCNEGCQNILIEPDFAGRIHTVMSLVAGMAIGLAPFLFWAAMLGNNKWDSLVTPTLLAGFLANLPGVTFWFTFLTGHRLFSIEGLLQRLGIVVVLAWVFYVALQLSMQAFREE